MSVEAEYILVSFRNLALLKTEEENENFGVVFFFI